MRKEKMELDLKEGALHRMLGIPEDQPIPITLLERILLARPGDIVKYKVNGKEKRIKVTPLLLKRARFAKVVKTKWNKGKR